MSLSPLKLPPSDHGAVFQGALLCWGWSPQPHQPPLSSFVPLTKPHLLSSTLQESTRSVPFQITKLFLLWLRNWWDSSIFANQVSWDTVGCSFLSPCFSPLPTTPASTPSPRAGGLESRDIHPQLSWMLCMAQNTRLEFFSWAWLYWARLDTLLLEASGKALPKGNLWTVPRWEGNPPAEHPGAQQGFQHQLCMMSFSSHWSGNDVPWYTWTCSSTTAFSWDEGSQLVFHTSRAPYPEWISLRLQKFSWNVKLIWNKGWHFSWIIWDAGHPPKKNETKAWLPWAGRTLR